MFDIGMLFLWSNCLLLSSPPALELRSLSSERNPVNLEVLILHLWAQAGSVHQGPLITEGGSVIKNLPANAGDARDTGLIPGLGGSPGIENGNTFQYSCLENSMDGGVWQATNPWGHKESDTTKCVCTHIHTHRQGLAAKIFRTKSYQRQCGQREIPQPAYGEGLASFRQHVFVES